MAAAIKFKFNREKAIESQEDSRGQFGMGNKGLQERRKPAISPAEKPVSLRPLKVEEALGDLLRISPSEKRRASRKTVALGNKK